MLFMQRYLKGLRKVADDKTPSAVGTAASTASKTGKPPWYKHVQDTLAPYGVATRPMDTPEGKGGKVARIFSEDAKPLETTFDEMRKLYTQGVPEATIKAQRESAQKYRRGVANRIIPADMMPILSREKGFDTATIPHILPYAPNGEKTDVEPLGLYAWNRVFPFGNRILIGRAKGGDMERSGALPQTTAVGGSPSVLFFGDKQSERAPITREQLLKQLRVTPEFLSSAAKYSPEDYKRMERLIGEILDVQNNPETIVPSGAVLTHETLHPRNEVYELHELGKMLGDTDKMASTIGKTQVGARKRNDLVPYAPGWDVDDPWKYVRRTPRSRRVAYYGNRFDSPRQQYFTGVMDTPHASKDPRAEAGTGTAQLVANEMRASKRFPTSYQQLWDMARERGAVTDGPFGQLSVNYGKFFTDPQTINTFSSGLNDFTELENIYRTAERDWANTRPGFYTDPDNKGGVVYVHPNLTGSFGFGPRRRTQITRYPKSGQPVTETIHAGKQPLSFDPYDFSENSLYPTSMLEERNAAARKYAQQYRANMDALIHGAYL